MPFERRPFGERKMYKVTCAECGQEAEVPFKPDGVRPVYCRDCYRKHKTTSRRPSTGRSSRGPRQNY